MRVPRVTEQQVAITPLPNARQQLRVSADTFGAQRARRLSQGAEGLAEAGDALARVAFERQADRIEAEAEAAFARWQVAATDTLAGYRGLQGGDAVGAYDAAYAELTGLRARIGGELGGGDGGGGGGGGRVQDLFLRQVANRQPAFLAGLERHRDAQSQVYRSVAMDARLQSAVAAGLADPLLGPGAELEIQALAQQQGEALGLPPETVETIALGYVSQIHVGRVEGLLTEERAAEARAYLETHGPGMTPADRQRLDTKTKAAEFTAEVTALSQAIASGGPLPAFAREREVDTDAATGRGGGGGGGDESNRGSDGNGDSGLDRSSADPNSNDATLQGEPAEVEPSVSAPGSPAAFDSPAAFGPRATAAQAKAAAQAELLAGSPEAAPHELHRDRMARLAGVETENPQVLGGAADELTAAYERETTALQADKATAQAEIARSLRSGAATPASLPPDLAAVLSGEEQAELEDWWRDGLRVAPDAALFESLHALFPAFPEEVSLEAPRIARHLSPEQQALVRRRQAENETLGAPGAATGEGVGADSRVHLALLDETLTEAGFDAWAEGPDGPWGVKRRRVGMLPDAPDPRETQLAVGIFGDDGGEGGGRDGGESDRFGDEPEQAGPSEGPPQDAAVDPQAAPTESLEEDAAFDEAAAEALADLIEQAADLTGLSEEQVELLGREALKFIPGVGAPLSYQDGVEALAQARRALDDEDYWAALLAASEGLIELAGIVPGLGPVARGAKAVGKTVGRAALDILGRVRRTRRGRELARTKTPGGPTARMPEGAVTRVRTKDRELGVTVLGKTKRQIEDLHTAVEDAGDLHAEALSDLVDGARLTTLDKARSNIVNLDQLGGQADALAAYHRSIRAAGGRLDEIGRNDKGNPSWTSPDGVIYEIYVSDQNTDTVIAIIPSSRAPRKGKWQLKVRFRTPRSDEGQTK